MKGEGNQQDYGMRVYDPRIGKFLSVDPLTRSYPYYTPYSFAGNKPIWARDLDGLEERYFQMDIVIGNDNKIKSVNSYEIEGLRAGLHFRETFNGVRVTNNPIGPYGIGDQYSISISRQLSDGSVVKQGGTLFISRKQTWLESMISPVKSPTRGGGIMFTSSQAGDGISGAGSLNKYEPLSERPDGEPVNIDPLVDAMGMAKTAIEGSVIKAPKGFLEVLELVKQNLDLFDAGSKVSSVIDRVKTEVGNEIDRKGSDDTSISVKSPTGWYYMKTIKKDDMKKYKLIEGTHMEEKPEK